MRRRPAIFRGDEFQRDGVMRSAHVPPFVGPEAVFVAQFYVSPR